MGIAKIGRIDAAFCNAGICKNIPAETMNLEEWNQAIAVYLAGDSSAVTTGSDFVINGTFTCI